MKVPLAVSPSPSLSPAVSSLSLSLVPPWLFLRCHATLSTTTNLKAFLVPAWSVSGSRSGIGRRRTRTPWFASAAEAGPEHVRGGGGGGGRPCVCARSLSPSPLWSSRPCRPHPRLFSLPPPPQCPPSSSLSSLPTRRPIQPRAAAVVWYAHWAAAPDVSPGRPLHGVIEHGGVNGKVDGLRGGVERSASDRRAGSARGGRGAGGDDDDDNDDDDDERCTKSGGKVKHDRNTTGSEKDEADTSFSPFWKRRAPFVPPPSPSHSHSSPRCRPEIDSSATYVLRFSGASASGKESRRGKGRKRASKKREGPSSAFGASLCVMADSCHCENYGGGRGNNDDYENHDYYCDNDGNKEVWFVSHHLGSNLDTGTSTGMDTGTNNHDKSNKSGIDTGKNKVERRGAEKLLADYAAIVAGLRAASSMGVRRLVVESDSHLVLRQLGKKYRVKSEKLAPRHAEAMRMLCTFDEWQVREVAMDVNMRAVELAQLALVTGTSNGGAWYGLVEEDGIAGVGKKKDVKKETKESKVVGSVENEEGGMDGRTMSQTEATVKQAAIPRAKATKPEPKATEREIRLHASPFPQVLPNLTYVLRFDGASRGNPGPAGAGMALFLPALRGGCGGSGSGSGVGENDDDASASVVTKKGCAKQHQQQEEKRKEIDVEVWSGRLALPYRATCNVAEYEALLGGLRAALNGGIRRIIVEGDSQLVVRQLDGTYQVKSMALMPRHKEAKQLLDKFDFVTLRHIRRELNGRADKLANMAIDDLGKSR